LILNSYYLEPKNYRETTENNKLGELLMMQSSPLKLERNNLKEKIVKLKDEDLLSPYLLESFLKILNRRNHCEGRN
jgi:hypothetical protein